MILVVGATGQLGTAVVRKLARAGRPVRALVRPSSSYEHLMEPGVEFAFGDLRDRFSLRHAVEGATAVVATASLVFPRGRYDFERDEIDGYRDLIAACEGAGVERFVFVSNKGSYVEPYLTHVQTLRCKLRIEEALKASRLAYTIFRATPFMDDYFALIGSTLPLRGEDAATLHRPFWFSRATLSATAGSIERFGVASVPGPRNARYAFIALDDVATYLVRALDVPDAERETIEIGGPENLSWEEVAALYGKLLDRPVRVVETPPAAYRLGIRALRRLSPAAANQMAIMWALAGSELMLDGSVAAERFGVDLTTAESYLRSKLPGGNPAGTADGAAHPSPPPVPA